MVIETKRIMVIGDFMLDRYITGTINRISPEAPVPILDKENEKYVLGGAANVVANLLAANQEVYPITIIGDDIYGDLIIEELKSNTVSCRYILKKKDRRTTVKTRIMAQNNHQLVRVDEEDRKDISEEYQEEIIDIVKTLIRDIDVVILSDYLKGVLPDNVCQSIIHICNENNKLVLADVKSTKAEKYANVYVIKPNKKELHNMTQMSVDTNTEILSAAMRLMELTKARNIVVTLGSKGMLVLANNLTKWLKCSDHEVYDVSGAGDTVLSYLSLCIANGMDILSSAIIANEAAGIKVTKVGTAPVALHEIGYSKYSSTSPRITKRKIIDQNQITDLLENYRNKKIVFTNGCFDILHRGHISYLQKAKKLGDILIIGVNSDASVKRLKGNNRPINSAVDRCEILAALECVDFVIVFSEDTPMNLIKKVRPDVLVKGADYENKVVVGKKFVEEYGGTVKLIEYVSNHSTTQIVDKLSREGRYESEFGKTN